MLGSFRGRALNLSTPLVKRELAPRLYQHVFRGVDVDKQLARLPRVTGLSWRTLVIPQDALR